MKKLTIPAILWLLVLFLSASVSANPFASKIAKANPEDVISIVTFNIKWLGHYKKKDNQALSEFLSPYDVVLVQELVSPPYAGHYTDGTRYKGDKESAAFFDAMKRQGFSYQLSGEDTGERERIHDKTPKTEWFVVFYRPDRVQPANNLSHGFLAQDRSNNPNFSRVPYAFAFKTGLDKSDFGGLIGAIFTNPRKALDDMIDKENQDGWNAHQIQPHSTTNLLVRVLQLVVLVCTLGIWTWGSGYIVLFERDSS